MPSQEYAERTHQVTFSSSKENSEWISAALGAKRPLNKYVLEMARRGRDAEANRPVDHSPELNKLREENTRLSASEAELRRLYEHTEAELFKLRHTSFLQPPDSLQEPSRKLVEALRSSARPHSGRELLRVLAIDPQDIEAMKILQGQLQVLKGFGLVQESAMGWKWIG